MTVCSGRLTAEELFYKHASLQIQCQCAIIILVNGKLIHIKERALSYLLSSFQTCPNFSEEQFIHRDGEKGTFVPSFKKQKAFETLC